MVVDNPSDDLPNDKNSPQTEGEEGKDIGGYLDELSGFESDEEFLTKLNQIANFNLVDVLKERDYQYLLLQWATLAVYVIEPTLPFKEKPDKIPVKNGLTIYDYGSYFVISKGELWPETASNAKFIESAKAIIDYASFQGITRVSLSGHVIGCRAAWLQSLDSPTKAEYYKPGSPTVDDLKRKYILDTLKHLGYETLTRQEVRPG